MTTRRAVLCIGTSLTYGYSQDATPYPVRLQALLDVPVVNLGVGGDRFSTISARYTTYGQPFPYDWVSLEGGTNDMALDSMSAATLWAAYVVVIEAAIAAGQRVVLIPPPPRWNSSSWDNTKETQRLAFIALAESYVAAHPEVKLVAVDTLLGNGGSPVAINASYDYGDHLHLNGTGMQVLAQAVADAMAS